MTKTKIALVALLAACGSISLSSCSSQSHNGGANEEAADLQEVGFNLRTNGGEVTAVAYKITSSGGTVIDQGTFETPEQSASFKAKLRLRVGTGYTIELTATATVDGNPAPCEGSQTFNVVAGSSTSVAVALVCTAPGGSVAPPSGTADVTATLSIVRTPAGECGITNATIGPLTQYVGHPITLTSDLVGAGAAGVWSAAGGLVGAFGNSGASDTTFTCSTASSGTITLTVTGSNSCADSVSAAVTCLADPSTVAGPCGNGVLNIGETCDDGNTVNTDTCKNDCSGPFVIACGDNVLSAGEACDDGNTTSGDGCSATCTVEVAVVCGNGIVQGAEACDDGNTVNTDMCKNDCSGPFAVTCGDGVVSAGEACDDSNTTNGDGCSSTCTVEIPVVCGNGIIQGSEVCDDGNTVDTDACKNDCSGPGTAIIPGSACDACLGADSIIGAYQTSACAVDPLCLAVERCVATTGCYKANGVASECYCGDTNGADCSAAAYNATGLCKAPILAAISLPSPTNADVNNVMFDPAFSVGNAFFVLSYVQPIGVCTTECNLP